MLLTSLNHYFVSPTEFDIPKITLKVLICATYLLVSFGEKIIEKHQGKGGVKKITKRSPLLLFVETSFCHSEW